MFIAYLDGKDLHLIDDYGGASHFIWRDATHILCWAPRPEHGPAFYLFEDGGDHIEAVGKGVMAEDGHCTYLPGNRCILCHTYPDKNRPQHPYLYDTRMGTRHALGHFLSPRDYSAEWRCDMTPRHTPTAISLPLIHLMAEMGDSSTSSISAESWREVA